MKYLKNVLRGIKFRNSRINVNLKFFHIYNPCWPPPPKGERERERFMNIIIPSMATHKICLICHPFVDFEWSEVSFNLLKLIYWPNFHPRSLKFFQIFNQSQINIYSNISSEFYSYLFIYVSF